MPTPRQGKFDDVVVAAGQNQLIQGAVLGLVVEDRGALTFQGALAGAVRVDGVLVAHGAITGEIVIGASGVALLAGVIQCRIRNEGVACLDEHPPGGVPVDITNVSEGRSGTFAELPSHLRAKLPTVTVTQD